MNRTILYMALLVTVLPGGCSRKPENQRLIWSFETGDVMPTCPAIAPDGTIYIGSLSRYFYALSPQGKLKWKFNTRDWVISSASIGADGTVYVGSYNHYLYAFRNNGQVLWKFKTRKFVFSSPTIYPDGLLLVGSDDGMLYALQTESKGLAFSPWPKFRTNTANSGSSLALYRNQQYQPQK